MQPRLGGDGDGDGDDVINRGEQMVFSGLNTNNIWILIFDEYEYLWPIKEASKYLYAILSRW